MVAALNKPIPDTGNISRIGRARIPERAHVRHAVKMLANALQAVTDTTVRERLARAEDEALLAEIRITQLENRISEMIRERQHV